MRKGRRVTVWKKETGLGLGFRIGRRYLVRIRVKICDRKDRVKGKVWDRVRVRVRDPK